MPCRESTCISSSWLLVLLNSYQILGFTCEFWACLIQPMVYMHGGTCMFVHGLYHLYTSEWYGKSTSSDPLESVMGTQGAPALSCNSQHRTTYYVNCTCPAKQRSDDWWGLSCQLVGHAVHAPATAIFICL